MLPSFHDSVTAKLECILLNNFYVCGPTSMKLILHLVSKVNVTRTDECWAGDDGLDVITCNQRINTTLYK